jgi:two-component system sensor histidine kinase/response regulator
MRNSPKQPVPFMLFLLVVGLALVSTWLTFHNLEAVASPRSSFIIGLVGFGLASISIWLFYAHRHAQTRLHEITALQTGIIRNANVAVISTSPTGVIRSFNPTAERWLGWRADEVVGHKTPIAFHDSAEIEQYARDLSAGSGLKIAPGFDVLAGKVRAGLDTVDEREWTYVRKDGSRFPVWLSFAALRSKRGHITGYFSVASNISDRKKAEQALRDAASAAQESVRLKSEFLANMSHEIRTPLNAIIGMTGLILDTDLTTDQRSFTETVRTSSEALLTVINDILDFSKIEAGQLTVETVNFDLHDPIEGTLELLAEKAGSQNLELAYLIEENAPAQLCGDPGRLRQILLNLVNNAIKFTEQGEVVVRVAKVAEAGRVVTLRFTITDTGIGIAPEAQAKLFQPFVQADGSTTRKYGGTGLGLAICKQLVGLMHGEIGVESAPGHGSTFWFTAQLSLQPETAKVVRRRADLAGTHILIVDDNATNREIFQRQLTSWHVRHASACSGQEALDILRANGDPFDAALLDMQMPNMDGLTLARRIHADPVFADLKMLILSSMGRSIPPADLADAGVALTLLKPIKQTQLHDALTSVLAQRPSTAVRVRRPAAPPMVASGKVRILVAEDNVVNQRVALLQLERLGHRADIAGNGLEVLSAVDTVHYDVIFMDCHMPELDGYETTRRLRMRETERRARGEKFAPLYIIAMTANAMQGDREACLAAGMNDYVSKPVRPAELAASLARVPAATA